MSDSILLGKLALGILFAAFVLLFVGRPIFQTMPKVWFNRLVFLWMIVSRLGLFFIIYWGLGLKVQGDVVGYYYPQALDVLQGKLVYRDFYSSYGPLFPYILSGLIKLWNDPRCIVLFSIILELISIPIWMSFSRRVAGEGSARVAIMLYLLSPIPFYTVVISGSNQIWVSFLLAVSIFVLLRYSSTVSGFIMSLSVLAVKVLALIFVPVLVLSAAQNKDLGKQRQRLGTLNWKAACFFICAFVLPIGASFAWLFYRHANPFMPLLVEGKAISSGNFPYLLSLFGLSPRGIMGYVCMILCVVTLIIFFLWAIFKDVNKSMIGQVWLLTGILCIFMMFSKKSFSSYLVMSFFPLCITISTAAPKLKDLVIFSLLGGVAILEPSLWFRWLQQNELGVLFQDKGIFIHGVIFLFVEGLLLFCYGYFFYCTCNKISNLKRQSKIC